VKTILYVSHDAGYTGAPLCLFDIIKNLDRNKYKPVFMCPARGPLCEELAGIGVEVHTFGTFNLIFLLRFMRKEKISLVHANTLYSYCGAIAGRLSGIPVLWHVHEDPRTNLEFRFLIKIAPLLSTKIIVVSRAMKEATGLGEICSVVYNGVDLEAFKPQPGDVFRQRFRADVIVCQVGSMEPRKGTEFFVRSAPMVLEKFPGAKFLLQGVSPPHQRHYLQKMKNLVQKLGIEKQVIFIGQVGDIREILNSLDVVVLASLREPLGRVLLEAMACGKPVVATRVGGIPEVVEDGITGILVPPADPLALANAIINILSDREMAKKMGMEGRKRVEEEFSIERYVRNIERIYEEILQ